MLCSLTGMVIQKICCEAFKPFSPLASMDKMMWEKSPLETDHDPMMHLVAAGFKADKNSTKSIL